MQVVDAGGAAAQILPAVLLLSAALAKALDLEGFRQTLTQLGLRWRAMAVVVVGAELVTALALLIAPAAWWPRVLVGVLATGFAAAGLLAALTKRRVNCRCFGSAGSGMLGWTQVAWWPVWLALAGFAQWRGPDWSVDTGLLILAGAVLGLLALRMPRDVRLVRTLHEDRIALAPLYSAMPGDSGGEGRSDGSLG